MFFLNFPGLEKGICIPSEPRQGTVEYRDETGFQTDICTIHLYQNADGHLLTKHLRTQASSQAFHNKPLLAYMILLCLLHEPFLIQADFALVQLGVFANIS